MGDLDRVTSSVRCGGFASCAHDLGGQAKVIYGTLDLIAEKFCESARHACAAVGASRF